MDRAPHHRDEAVRILTSYIGTDLRPLADTYNVTVWKDGKLNKGWAGQVIQWLLGHPPDSSRNPDFGTWELKAVSLHRERADSFSVKETMQITMIDPEHVIAHPFDESHLLHKLETIVVAAREFVDKSETNSKLVAVAPFTLTDPAIRERVRKDYDLVRETLRSQGLAGLSGKMGELVQPRTKGPGHGSTSRAFYARTQLVSAILGLRPATRRRRHARDANGESRSF
jgi:DNA mismatch repair protein MutH